MRGVRGTRLLAAMLAVCAALAGCGEGDGPSGTGYTLEFAVTTPGRIGALQIEVTHLGDSGEFIGRLDQADCVPLVDAIVAANAAGERTLKVGLISLQGILAPSAIMRCGFRTGEELGPQSFLVEVTDASQTNGDPIDPPPTVVISSVVSRCESEACDSEAAVDVER